MSEDVPTGIQLVRIHNFLARELEAFSSEEILRATNVDIERSPDILHSLTGEKSKVIREKDDKWRWASKYQVRDFSQLIALLARSTDGICEKDLYDSYKGVKDDLKKLKKKCAVYEIKSGSRILLFPHDPRLDVQVSDDLKEQYNRMSLPDAIEVHRYLVEKGLKDTEDATGVKIAQPVTRKRPSKRGDRARRAKKIKLTNTHMENTNIDLSKDFNTGKESAFQ